MKHDLLARYPLLSLRHLEAAVRLESFDKAAAELKVTPSAVSQQIKRLEASLGQNLFERSANRVMPNERGKELGQILSEAFERIDSGLRRAMSETGKPSVKIRLFQTLANRLLVPRLGKFTRQFPEIAVEFETGFESFDFGRTDLDLALSADVPSGRNLRSELVLVPRLCAVCAPDLAERLKTFDDLTRFPMIASRNRMHDWSRWLEAAGQPKMDQRPLLVFSNSTLVYETALSGAGVAIAQLELVLGDLESGRLVKPFPQTIESDTPLYLFEPDIGSRRPAVRRFRKWLLDEIADLTRRTDAHIQATMR